MTQLTQQLQNKLFSTYTSPDTISGFETVLSPYLQQFESGKQHFINAVTEPLEVNLSNDQFVDYCHFLGNVKSYLYNTLFPKNREGYFVIVADPPLKAYDYQGQNSLDIEVDDTLYARMENI